MYAFVWGCEACTHVDEAIVDKCSIHGRAYLFKVVKCHDKHEHTVWAVSGWWQRAMGVCTNVVQHEAEMALEYLIFDLTLCFTWAPSKQCEPRLQATQCNYST